MTALPPKIEATLKKLRQTHSQVSGVLAMTQLGSVLLSTFPTSDIRDSYAAMARAILNPAQVSVEENLGEDLEFLRFSTSKRKFLLVSKVRWRRLVDSVGLRHPLTTPFRALHQEIRSLVEPPPLMDLSGMAGLLNVTVPRILLPVGGPGLLGGARQPPLPKTPPDAAWLRDRMVDAAANLELDEVWSLLAQTNRMKRICGGQTWSPLPDVVRYGQTSYVLPIVDRLNSLGCDLRAQNASGSTAIHEATRSRNDPVLRHLLQLDDDLVNCQDAWGQTPLHIYLQTIVTPSPSELDRRVVEALLTPQYDWTVRDAWGMSASFRAVASNVHWSHWRLTEQSAVHLDLFETNSEGKTLLSAWLDTAGSQNLQLNGIVAQAFTTMSSCWQLPDGPTTGRLLATRPPYAMMKTWMDMLLRCPRRISASLCYEDSHGLQLRYLVPHALHKSSHFHRDWDSGGTLWKNLDLQILRVLQIAGRDPLCHTERTLRLPHRTYHLFNLVSRAAQNHPQNISIRRFMHRVLWDAPHSVLWSRLSQVSTWNGRIHEMKTVRRETSNEVFCLMIDVDKGHLPSLYSSLLLEPDVSMIRHYTLALHLCETDKDLSETVRSSMTRTVRKLLLTVAVTPSTGEFVAELMYFHPNVAVDLLLTQNFAEDEGVTVAMNVADAVVRLEKVPGYGRTAANAQVQVCRNLIFAFLKLDGRLRVKRIQSLIQHPLCTGFDRLEVLRFLHGAKPAFQANLVHSEATLREKMLGDMSNLAKVVVELEGGATPTPIKFVEHQLRSSGIALAAHLAVWLVIAVMCDGTPDPFMVMHVTSINTPRYWFNLFRHSITYALGFKTIDGPVHFWTNFVHLLMQAAQYFCLVYFVVLCIYSETRETLWAYILLVAINFCVAAYRATVVPHMAREVNYAISENVDFAALERPLEMKPACDFNKAWEGFPSSQHLLACEFGPPAPIWYQVFRRTNPMIGELRFAHRPKNLYERHMKWRAYYTNNWSSDVPNQTAPDLRLRWTLLRIGDFASYMKHYGIFRRPLEAAVKAETFTGRRFTRYFLLYLLMCAVPYNLNLTGLLGHPFAHVLSNRVLFQTFEGAHQNHYLEAVFAYLTMQQVFLLGVPLFYMLAVLRARIRFIRKFREHMRPYLSTLLSTENIEISPLLVRRLRDFEAVYARISANRESYWTPSLPVAPALFFGFHLLDGLFHFGASRGFLVLQTVLFMHVLLFVVVLSVAAYANSLLVTQWMAPTYKNAEERVARHASDAFVSKASNYRATTIFGLQIHAWLLLPCILPIMVYLGGTHALAHVDELLVSL